MTAPVGLPDLEAVVARDLALLGYPPRDWVVPKTWQGNDILDVLIVGAGQSGLSSAFALMRENVRRILVVDEKPQGKEGPWKDFARMATLRTPKYVTGPDLGIPSLTFQSWYEAQWGADAWQAVNKIPKEGWADYLAWYRRVLNLPVRNGVSVGALSWNADAQAWNVPAKTTEGSETLLARKVVLATGIEGSGQWEIPEFVKRLPKKFWAHTREDIDFAALKGKRVGILGAGASAFDNASVALETGAAEVALFFRRDKLVNINPYRWAEFTGFLKHHASVSDAEKWKFAVTFLRKGQLPPADTFARASAFPGFSVHPGEPWMAAQTGEHTVTVTTTQGPCEFDYLILGTGFITDLSRRPELADIYGDIAVWSDRFSPPDGMELEDLSRHPYLGAGFEFQPKHEGHTPWISSLFCYTFGGLVSLGFSGGSISGMKYSLPKLVDGITRQLYNDDLETYFASLENYDTKEF
jgi:cation diffusion facilitator CzcD-associated flavoprotein CzcO